MAIQFLADASALLPQMGQNLALAIVLVLLAVLAVLGLRTKAERL